MRFFIGMVAVLVAFVTVTANAESVAGLYQVREELDSQESEMRDAGLQQAFATLVQRLTGKTDAAQSPDLAEYRADPQSLISRYGYEGNTLIVSFDPQSVQSALRAAHLPIWGSNRPMVLAWWLVEDLQGTRLVSDGQPGTEEFYSAAQYYGVPARMPLGDLDEQLLATGDALDNSEQVLESAERYNADVVVIVHQQLDGETLHAQWQLWVGDERQQGQVSADTQSAVARDVFAQVNQRLAQRFAIKPGQGELLTVQVSGVDLERFVLVERLLEPFAAQLQTVSNDDAQWTMRSTVEQVRAQLALGHLQEQSAPPPAQEVSAEDVTMPQTSILTKTQADTQTLYFSW